MADLSLAARHLLKLIQDAENQRKPIGNSKAEYDASKELRYAGLIERYNQKTWTLTHLGYDRSLTK